MEHAIGFAMTLRPRVKADEFEALFRRAVRAARKNSQVLEKSEFLLYRLAGARKDYLWVTRFPAREFDRVTRTAIPFILFVILKVLQELRQHSSSGITAFSAPAKSPAELVEDWNKEFGRFTKLSLEPPA